MAPPWHPGNGAHRADREGLDVQGGIWSHVWERIRTQILNRVWCLPNLLVINNFLLTTFLKTSIMLFVEVVCRKLNHSHKYTLCFPLSWLKTSAAQKKRQKYDCKFRFWMFMWMKKKKSVGEYLFLHDFEKAKICQQYPTDQMNNWASDSWMRCCLSANIYQAFKKYIP